MDIKLSLAMIVRDEEEVLPRCLESVKDLVDEMIVVDTGSEDSTPDIIQKFAEKVHRFDWINDFATARDYSFSLCSGDFILWLDADDVMRPEDARLIRNIDYSDKEIIIAPYVYYHDEFGNDDLIIPRERIVRRSLGLNWNGKIHEHIPLIGHKQYVTDFKIHHHRRHISSDRNLQILESVVKGDNPMPGAMLPGVDSRYIYYLGREYKDAGRHDEAIMYLQEFVDRKEGFWEDVFKAYDLLAECFAITNNDEFAVKSAFNSIQIEPRRAEPYCFLGDFYMSKRDFRRAIHWYEVASRLERPADLLSSFRTKYYSWLPYIQLTICYNHIGQPRKAYEANEEFMRLHPQDPRGPRHKAILDPARHKDKYKKDGHGKKLNLGCGSKAIPGYVGVDLFKGEAVDEIFEMTDIPYWANTIGGIYSEHSLEHISMEHVRPTLQEWFRVLEPGAELILKMPDFEQCCEHYLKAPLTHSNFYRTRCWYKWTIFGRQKSLQGEPDEAQFHTSGFSKDEMKIVLEETGFKVTHVSNYDGCSTPSMEFHAVKPAKGPKVAWVCPENWEAAQTRIRVLNVNNWLKRKGYISRVTTLEDVGDAEVVIVGKTFDEATYKAVLGFKEQGKKLFCDLCEDILQFPWVKETVEACHEVVCCSMVLADKVEDVNPNVVIIEDAWE